jgi:DNA-binding NarL/FixJ family response regulator
MAAGHRMESLMLSPNQDAPITVLAVDDHPLLRQGLAAALEGAPDMKLVGEAANGREAIERFRQFKPDVTLMDLRMHEMSGLDAIVAIRSEFPRARIIVLTTYEGDAQALSALKAGAAGYMLKSAVRKDLLDTIRAVHAGERRIPPTIANDIAEHAADDALSGREIDILRRVAAGKSNKLIAIELHIAENTVKAHMRSILPKLEASDRTHAVTIALRRGILDLC